MDMDMDIMTRQRVSISIDYDSRNSSGRPVNIRTINDEDRCFTNNDVSVWLHGI